MLPRERLIKYGPKSLEVEELFAIILGTGTKDEDVFTLSKRIFDNGLISREIYDKYNNKMDEVIELY